MKTMLAGMILALAATAAVQPTGTGEAYRQSYEKQAQVYLAQYDQRLDALLAGAKRKGDLDNTLLIQAEKKRLAAERTVPDPRAAPDAYRPATELYAQTMAALLERYVAALEDLIKKDVAADRIEEAKRVKAEKEKITPLLAAMQARRSAQKAIRDPKAEASSPAAASTHKVQALAGVWDVTFADGFQVHFTLSPDGTALKAPGNIPGRWTAAKNGVWITWQDGWKDHIELGPPPRDLVYAPGASTARAPTNKGRASHTPSEESAP